MHTSRRNAPLSILFLVFTVVASAADCVAASLDEKLDAALQANGFPTDMNTQLEQRLGRKVDPKSPKVLLGRDLFFDKILAIGNDNSCAGCHSPRHGFGDTQSIAIGVKNNDIVGPSRTGPRNQRRTPMVLNNAFYPKLMWNGRFAAISGDPFDNSAGFDFPPPEGVGDNNDKRFPARDPQITHLLMAQAQIPPTELPEMAGFRYEYKEPGKTIKTRFPAFPTYREPRFAGQQFPIRLLDEQSDAPATADILPHPLGGFYNEPIRGVVLLRLNEIKAYRERFAASFSEQFKKHKRITFEMIGAAIAEFEFSLTFVDAPLDQFARGNKSAMTADQKEGALLFFGKARCVECHAVAGKSSGMFSDFQDHVIAIPQIAPKTQEPGGDIGNVVFRGAGANEDFGLEDITARESDRYKFRTAPLRNIKLQPTFGHNGAWTGEVGLERIIRHHLNPVTARHYDPASAGVAADLRENVGPIDPVLARLSPRLATPIELTDGEVAQLVTFVRDGLFDKNTSCDELAKLIPESVPSGRSLQTFEK